ncbi:hypothetical protein DMENIID0001_133280 [Sergentomyia squamirostris]
MATFSKYFYESVGPKTCEFFTHPGVTCQHFSFTTFFDGIIGGLQYYFPIIILPALQKYDRWSWEFWRKVLREYAQAIMAGSCFMIFFAFGCFCYLFNFIKRHHNVFVFVPCVAGSMFCYFLPPNIREMQSIGGFNMFLEFLIRTSKSKLVQKLKKSTLFAIFMFQVFGAAIAYVYKKSNIRKFWFFGVPIPTDANSSTINNKKMDGWIDKIVPTSRHICSHNETCESFVLKEFTRTTSFGLVMTLLKAILSHTKSSSGNFLTTLAKDFDYRLFIFLSSYGSLFKLFNCLINRHQQADTPTTSMISGFLAGIAFSAYPKFVFFSFGFSRAVQFLWLHYNATAKNKPKIIQYLNKLPFSTLIYTLSSAYLYQCRVFYPSETPKYIHQIMTIATQKRSDTLAESYAAMVMGLA